MIRLVALAIAFVLSPGTIALAEEPENSGVVFVTLGTGAGPVARPERSQSANLLSVADHHYLIDVGVGTTQRLGAIGLQPASIDAVFISHLHLDHVGGLQGIIGLRWMTEAPGSLPIYGPPGTKELVQGLVESLAPSARIGFGFGDNTRSPADTVNVIEIDDGDEFAILDLRVRAARNSHFSTGEDAGPVSLSFRFSAPGRSIGYTGDTGPSDAIAELFAGVDLLVSEVIDVESTLADVRAKLPQLTESAMQVMQRHLGSHHLPAIEAGRLASAAGAGELVLTHLAMQPGGESVTRFIADAGTTFDGPIAVASDLDRF